MSDRAFGSEIDAAGKRDIDKLCRRSKSAAAVFVNSGDANSYGVIVNLGRSGVPVISVSSNQNNVTFSSRYATKVLSPDYRESEDVFIDFLSSVGASMSPKPVLFVNGDEQLMVLLRHRERLERHFFFPFAPIGLAERLVNKVAFYRMLLEYSVLHAETYLPENIGDVELLGEKLDYPFILKPAQSQSFSDRFGNKCIRVDSAATLLDQYERISAVEGSVIVQKEMAGTERYLVYTYFSKDSVPLGVFCYRKMRIVPTDFGNACVCKTVENQEVIDLCLDLLTKIGYQGLAEAEIQRDANDGQLKLVEINARTTTQSRLSGKCGVNMEYIAYQDALGFELRQKVNEDFGVLWVDLYRDTLSIFSSDGYLARNKITISGWIRSLRGERVFAYFSWSDPVPSVILFFRVLRLHLFKKRWLKAIRAAFASLSREKAGRVDER